MILVEAAKTDTIDDLRQTLQRAVQLEFATLPPYLYAWYTVGGNEPARSRILDIVHEEMIHMMLACNILNSLGQHPAVVDTPLKTVVPTYPGPLPFSIGSDDGNPFIVHLRAFSEAAMTQAAKIEEPENPIQIQTAGVEPEFHTIGQFYAAVKKALPAEGWNAINQIDSATAFPGELFPIRGRADAELAIDHIVSQGEGTDEPSEESPLDFQGQVAHFYRFSEIERNQVLEKDVSAPHGYRWGAELGIDFGAAAKAIDNPAQHDFSNDPAALAAQEACDREFTDMLYDLQRAVTGEPDRLGNAVRKMFDLSQAAYAALAVELADKPGFVAGPAFCFRPELTTQG